jgi:hypothetical protein
VFRERRAESEIEHAPKCTWHAGDSVDTTPLDILSAAAEAPRPQDVLDGIESFLAGDLRPEARARLEELRTLIVTRLHKASEAQRQLVEAKAALEVLVADGHPSEILGIAAPEVLEALDARIVALRVMRGRLIEPTT